MREVCLKNNLTSSVATVLNQSRVAVSYDETILCKTDSFYFYIVSENYINLDLMGTKVQKEQGGVLSCQKCMLSALLYL